MSAHLTALSHTPHGNFDTGPGFSSISQEASIIKVARYMDAASPFVAIDLCPRFSLTLVILMSFSLRSERFPEVAVGFRLSSGGRWGTDD